MDTLLKKYKLNEIDDFIQFVDENGGGNLFSDPEKMMSMGITHTSKIIDISDFPTPNEDPMSDEYHKYQIELYEKIANRKYIPVEGEKKPDFVDNTNYCNPWGTKDVSFISEQIKTIINSLILADLSEGDNVLDMGCGSGISSETIAYNGLNVDCYDLNPDYLNVIKNRRKIRNFDINVIEGNFDDLNLIRKYNLIFFFEAFHHSCNAKNLLKNLVENHLKEDGVIILAGEPISNRDWGLKWGIDLGPQAVYCIRKFGWFETNFSDVYLKEIFNSAGLEFCMVLGIGLKRGPVVIGMRKGVGTSENLKNKILKLISIETLVENWPEPWRGGIII